MKCQEIIMGSSKCTIQYRMQGTTNRVERVPQLSWCPGNKLLYPILKKSGPYFV
jgi:hypothetical protein